MRCIRGVGSAQHAGGSGAWKSPARSGTIGADFRHHDDDTRRRLTGSSFQPDTRPPRRFRMTRGWLTAALALTGLVLNWPHGTPSLQAQADAGPQWIWFDEGDPASQGPIGSRYFRRVLDLKNTVDEAVLDVTADDEFTVWFNGHRVGGGKDWKRVYAFDLKKDFVVGLNVLAVEARNASGP